MLLRKTVEIGHPGTARNLKLRTALYVFNAMNYARLLPTEKGGGLATSAGPAALRRLRGLKASFSELVSAARLASPRACEPSRLPCSRAR